MLSRREEGGRTSRESVPGVHGKHVEETRGLAETRDQTVRCWLVVHLGISWTRGGNRITAFPRYCSAPCNKQTDARGSAGTLECSLLATTCCSQQESGPSQSGCQISGHTDFTCPTLLVGGKPRVESASDSETTGRCIFRKVHKVHKSPTDEPVPWPGPCVSIESKPPGEELEEETTAARALSPPCRDLSDPMLLPIFDP
jgi:hypothetical protein